MGLEATVYKLSELRFVERAYFGFYCTAALKNDQCWNSTDTKLSGQIRIGVYTQNRFH